MARFGFCQAGYKEDVIVKARSVRRVEGVEGGHRCSRDVGYQEKGDMCGSDQIGLIPASMVVRITIPC